MISVATIGWPWDPVGSRLVSRMPAADAAANPCRPTAHATGPARSSMLREEPSCSASACTCTGGIGVRAQPVRRPRNRSQIAFRHTGIGTDPACYPGRRNESSIGSCGGGRWCHFCAFAHVPERQASGDPAQRACVAAHFTAPRVFAESQQPGQSGARLFGIAGRSTR